MKYLKTFENIDKSIFNQPSKFDTDCLEEVRSIFDQFAEERDFYKYEWTFVDHPNQEGIQYTYFTWEDLINQPEELMQSLGARYSASMSNDMLDQKYFKITISINQKVSDLHAYGLGAGAKRSEVREKIIHDIEDIFINRIEKMGYGVSMTFGSVGTGSGNSAVAGGVYTHQLFLKIHYSEA